MVDCFAIENSLTIDTNGDIKPCCKYKGKFGNITTTDVNLQNFLELKKNKNWPEGCSSCKYLEDNKIRSRRQTYLTRFNSEDFLLDLSIGNYCNLKCRMCNETLSTNWYNDAKKLGRILPKPFFLNNTQIDKIFDYIPKNKSITIELKGGEPLVTPNIQYLFEKAFKLNAKIICITNGTELPNWFLEKLNYMDIQLQMSIDGIKNTYNYVRGDKNFDWERCAERMSYLESLDIDFSYNYVVQNLTVNDMLDFENLTTKRINWIILNNPSYLICNNIPDENKNNILEKINKIKTCPSGIKELINKPCDLEVYKKFIEETKKLDKIRNQNLKNVLPHLLNSQGEYLYDTI
jgi:MoaA/NifB/PqqE/SkfB family radical SAM enzyme